MAESRTMSETLTKVMSEVFDTPKGGVNPKLIWDWDRLVNSVLQNCKYDFAEHFTSQ